MANIAIVILNWNGLGLLKTYLPLVLEHSSKADVIVVDNHSADGSVDFLQTNYPQVQIISLDKNYGFAGGYNRALKSITHEIVVLLNSDAAPNSEWIDALVAPLLANETVGATMPKIKDFKDPQKFEYAGAAGGFIDYLGYPFCRGRVFDTIEFDEGQYQQDTSVFWASGAAFAVRRELFLGLGGFDEDFFAHQEEIDLCWRILNSGYSIQYVAKSEVFHFGGATLHESNPHKTFLNFRNNLLMIIKNYPFRWLFFVVLMKLVLDGVAGLRFILKGNIGDCFAIIRAHFSFYKLFPKFMKKRSMGIIPVRLPSVMYKKSIVWQYYVLKKGIYPQL